MADGIRVNGNFYSWGSILIKVAGEVYYGFNDVSYSDKRERKLVYGMGKAQAPRGRTRGKYTPDPCKLKGPLSTVQALRAQLAALSESGVDYGDVTFLVTIQYVEGTETPILVELEDCTWTSNSSSASEGTDEIMDEFEFQPMRIKRNGLTLYDSSEEV